MAEERRRRRRGHRRGRGRGHPSGQPPQGGPPEVTEESEAPGVLPPRLRFRFGRRGGREREKTRERRDQARKERPAAAVPVDVSPLSFWRRGRARPYREQPMPRRTLRRTLRRIRGLHFPPWLPVVFIIVVVFGILGFLFFARGTAGRPRINDHWHARYEVIICGERQPNFPAWEGGVHTHGDGVIHIHPFTPAEEGAGARLVKWFEYGGGKLTQTEMHMPGTPKDEVYRNGDKCPDGSEAVLQVFVNGVKLDDWSRYIPQDGDQVRIVFGPEQAAAAPEGIQIPAEEATREISIEAGDRGQPTVDSFFSPSSFSIEAGETVKVNLENTGSVTHNLRIDGLDHEFETEDDFVTRPPDRASGLIKPGETGYTVIRIDEPGQYAFRCDIHPDGQFGTLTVTGEAPSPAPEETPATPAAEETPEP